MNEFLHNDLEKLGSISLEKAKLLKKELNIKSAFDLIYHFPFRYEDKSKKSFVKDLTIESGIVNISGIISKVNVKGFKKRLEATLEDNTGSIILIWFKGLTWISKKLKKGTKLSVCGTPSLYLNKLYIIHPEIILENDKERKEIKVQPIYKTTELLKKRFLHSKAIHKIVIPIIEKLSSSCNSIKENLPKYILENENFLSRNTSFIQIHCPSSNNLILRSRERLKFEEFFFLQIRILKQRKNIEEKKIEGYKCITNNLLKKYLSDYLSFELTSSQKKSIKEIYNDMKSGQQMNRLLQGDVGSGKTEVALMSILIAVSNNYQSAFVVPTEVLAEQHVKNLCTIFDQMAIKYAILTGSTKPKKKKDILMNLELGLIDIVIGTHALLEDPVKFNNLGLVIIDEQHKFGVTQRSKLWKKNIHPPHILIMTATPIPRTLAMTAYGDLNMSILSEMPPGRFPVKTFWVTDSARIRVFNFIKEQIKKGKQIYIVYPLIEESAKLDYKDLEDGYESIKRSFPNIPISIVHGKMNSEDKEYEMNNFVKGVSKIMISTTVIEVGINVPNATLMIIESAERFGLSQLHQLRGRVGRGNSQSYCVLISGYKLSKESKLRLRTMVETNDGFKIADTDLKIRGAGNILGTKQSGILNFKIADLTKDESILKKARFYAKKIILEDPNFEKKENLVIKNYLTHIKKRGIDMSGIS